MIVEISKGENSKEDMLGYVLTLLPNDTDKKLVQAICKKFEDAGYYIKIKFNGVDAKLHFRQSKSKKDLLALDIERDFTYKILLRLQNISEYTDKLKSLSTNILRQTLSGRECCDCGYCENSVRFSFDGTDYRKCAVICCGFVYVKLQEEDITSLLQLIDWELNIKRGA